MADPTVISTTTGIAAKWIERIDQRLKAEDTWRERAKKVVQRFRDERDAQPNTKTAPTLNSKVNILWSNTEVLKASLYAKTAKPDVRRRFPDNTSRKYNDVNRTAAELIERSLDYVTDEYDVDSPIQGAVEDMLLPGRGVVWISYEPEIEGDAEPGADAGGEDGDLSGDASEGEGRADAGQAPTNSGEGGPRIVSQKLCPDYVYWEDFCHGLARRWKDVPWVARRHALTVDDFEDKFPDAEKINPKVQADFELKDASGATNPDAAHFVEIWEIWNKPTKKRLYVARGYKDPLSVDDDPYGLKGFFPCPEPLYSVTTTDRMVPEPEFLQYQDQANELDIISTRITRLTDKLKWNGIYDATISESNVLVDMASADDGEFLPHQNFQQIRDKGGINAAFGFRPIELIEPVIASLDQRRKDLIQTIYEITGISDIIRGATDPRETKGAQQIKAQFGSMRLQARQREVQRFIRDLYRIMAEIIAEHFTGETLAEITGLNLPIAEEKQQAQMMLAAMDAPPMPQAGQPAGMSSQAPMQPPMGGPAQPPVGGAPMPMGMMQ